MRDEESLEKGNKREESKILQKKCKKDKKGVDKRKQAWYYN